ncbi:alpha/beta fold hydrolase [Streptomyces sp. NPDC001941]|uniref:thioesterase II family protein n=1 Tax=Streptomyces sp. NPDC001941 TaxID=3154659 RepID=UPI00331D3C92
MTTMENVHLICLPFAGAGASFFKDWQSSAPEGLHIVPVQLPGREERFIDAPHTEAARAVDEVYAAVLDRIQGADRVAVFGHSLGAVLAYDLAHRLADTQGVPLARLFVSGSPGPWNGRESRATGLDDDAFLAQVREFAGYDHPALAHPEMRELLLPMLRADVEMHENYRPASDKPLGVPVTALRGSTDELVGPELLQQWSAATTAAFSAVEMDGGHMYMADDAPALLRVIAAELGSADAR